MKKPLFVIGTIAMMIYSLSFLFTAMQWEGDGLLRGFGLISITLVFLAGAFLMKNMLFYSGTLAFILLDFALLFKIMHLAGANFIYIAGMITLSLIFIPFAGLWVYKRASN